MRYQLRETVNPQGNSSCDSPFSTVSAEILALKPTFGTQCPCFTLGSLLPRR